MITCQDESGGITLNFFVEIIRPKCIYGNKQKINQRSLSKLQKINNAKKEDEIINGNEKTSTQKASH